MPKVVSLEEWVQARTELLSDERAVMKQVDAIAEKRRSLPWMIVESDYEFEHPDGSISLSELFGSCSQLFVKHFMLAPGQAKLCVGCSLEADHVDGLLPHLRNNNLAYAAIARAPIGEIESLRERMGWQFPFVSSCNSSFNYDFNVSFTPEELRDGRAFYNYRYSDPELQDLSGNSVFYKDDTGRIYLTYASFGRGSEDFLGIYRYFDVAPEGRRENGPYHSLTDWARPHDMYGRGGTVEANGQYIPAPGCAC